MIRLLLVTAFLVVAAPSAQAEDMPRALSPDLIRTEHEMCSTSTGYGRDFVRFADIDGDGRRDVVLDYAQALCGGQPEPYCTREGCLLKVWTAKGGSHRLVWEGRATSWSLAGEGRHTTLIVDGRPFAP